MLDETLRIIADSDARTMAIWVLMNVPGAPPILQSVHILAIAALAGTVGILHLRLLGWAVGQLDPGDMIRRYRYWFVGSIGIAFLSGLPLVLARPGRYFLNPVAGAKVAFFAIAVVLTIIVFIREQRRPGSWHESLWSTRGLALVSTLAWVGVIFAGRWIAYVDYLYWDEG